MATSGDPEQRARFLREIATKGRSGAVAMTAAAGGCDPASTPVSASLNGGCWMLDGRESLVLDGDRADEVAVVARTPDGLSVLVVPGDQLDPTRTTSLDGSLHVADIDFGDVLVDDDRHLAAAGGNGAESLDTVVETALMGLSMTIVGACQRALDLALDHVRERSSSSGGSAPRGRTISTSNSAEPRQPGCSSVAPPSTANASAAPSWTRPVRPPVTSRSEPPPRSEPEPCD